MDSPAKIKRIKQRFVNTIYATAQGRFGVLIDTYGIAEHHGLDEDMLAMVIEYWEAKGFIATYEGTFYASLTLKGVESLEDRAPKVDHSQSARANASAPVVPRTVRYLKKKGKGQVD